MLPCFARITSFLRDERGTGMLPVALVLPAMAVSASVFAAAVLTTGQFSTDQFQQVAFSAVRETSTGIELDGPVVARTDGASITHLLIDVTTIPGGLPVELDPASTSEQTVVSYVDAANVEHDVPYAVQWIVGNGDNLLEPGELAEISVDLSGIVPAGESFTVEVRPAHGISLTVHRPIPSGGHLPAVLQLW